MEYKINNIIITIKNVDACFVINLGKVEYFTNSCIINLIIYSIMNLI
jgi:hypothetical protein